MALDDKLVSCPVKIDTGRSESTQLRQNSLDDGPLHLRAWPGLPLPPHRRPSPRQDVPGGDGGRALGALSVSTPTALALPRQQPGPHRRLDAVVPGRGCEGGDGAGEDGCSSRRPRLDRGPRPSSPQRGGSPRQGAAPVLA